MPVLLPEPVSEYSGDEGDDEGDDEGADAVSDNESGDEVADEGDGEGENEPEVDEQESGDDTGSAPATETKKMMAITHEDHQGDPDYKSKFNTLYPFSTVDFFTTANRDIGDKGEGLGSEESVVTPNRDTHHYAEPELCDPCFEEKAKIAELERENSWL